MTTIPITHPWLASAARLFATTERLPVELTDEEWSERADEAAKLHGMIAEAEDAEKARRASVKAQLDELKAERDRLLKQVHAHAEVRPVDVVGHGVLESNEVVVVRLDTGAVVSRRAMTASERNTAAQPDLPIPTTKRRPKADGGDSGGPLIAGEDAIAMMHGEHPEGLTDADVEAWRWTVTAEGPIHPEHDGPDLDAYLLELHDLDDLDLHVELKRWRELAEDAPGRGDVIELIRELLGDELPPEVDGEGDDLEDNDSEAGEPPTLDDLATWCGAVVEGLDKDATREDMLGWFTAAGQTIPRGLPQDRIKAATRLLEVARAAIHVRGS